MSSINDYWETRKNILDLEEQKAIGYDVILTKDEEIVNKILMREKEAELDIYFKDPTKFLPAIHFTEARKYVEKSKVFQFLQKLPKGAVLHGHDTSMASLDYIFSLTYLPNLYGKMEDGRFKFKLFDQRNKEYISDDWKSLEKWRRHDPTFDDYLKAQMSIIVKDPWVLHADFHKLWEQFMDTINTVKSLIFWLPVFEKYVSQVLLEHYQDNVMYMEIRTGFNDLFDTMGKKYSRIEIAEIYYKIINDFKAQYPRFVGAKLIYEVRRNINNDELKQHLATAKEIQMKYPNLLAGFDVSGPEDVEFPTHIYADELNKETSLNYLFHAGETNWYGYNPDHNLIDAVLLKTKRIGHGYTVIKHPKLLEMIKQRNIAIEVSPISNQVLGFVRDLRNHPASYYVANNYGMVLCSDNPCFWGAKGMSYDWYYAFMGIANKSSDLRLLKKWAMSAIEHSILDETENVDAISKFNADWKVFIDYIIQNFNSI